MVKINETPEWQQVLAREACLRTGLVLYGNTRDLFVDPASREYVTLAEWVLRRLGRLEPKRFTLAATWDMGGGLRFGDASQERRWDEALRRRLGTAAEPGGAPYDVGNGTGGAARQASTRWSAMELFAAFREVLVDGREVPLLVVDWSHLLVTQPAHPAAEEREWMLRLGKALVGEPVQPLDSDRLRRGRGLLVLLASNLGALPPGLYQGEPRVRLLAVPAPGRAERREFFRRHADELQCEQPRPPPGALAATPGREALADSLADLTDQLTTVDLRQVLALSRLAEQRLPAERLLNLYRFGDQRSPWEELSPERLQIVEEELAERVVGQEAAVRHVATMIIRAWLGLAGLQHSARRSKPKGTLFFVGPTGVGKTELAKACAAFLFGDESACIRFDMSEYNHEHSDQRLVGAPPGYVGFEEGGQLTGAVCRRPFSVLLFDEVEKAHGRVLDKFLQILEDGRLTDGRGETAWFSESVIIFTSNLGAADAPGQPAPAGDYERHFRRAVERHFVKELKRPELLNRLGDNIVVFHPVAGEGSRRRILDRKLEPLRDHLRQRWGVELRLSPEVEAHLVSQAREEHGGRGLLNAVERELLNPLARFLFERHHHLRKGRVVRASLQGEAPAFELVDGPVPPC